MLDRDRAFESRTSDYVNDWFFLAPPATADSFATLHTQQARYRLALAEVGIRPSWLHFYWAAHVHHALGISEGVMPTLEAGTELGLARGAASGRYCRTGGGLVANASVDLPPMRGPVWGGMAHRMCPRVGTVACPWDSHRCSAATPAVAATTVSTALATGIHF